MFSTETIRKAVRWKFIIGVGLVAFILWDRVFISLSSNIKIKLIEALGSLSIELSEEVVSKILEIITLLPDAVYGLLVGYFVGHHSSKEKVLYAFLTSIIFVISWAPFPAFFPSQA